MLRYQPPKSSVWGHSLRKIGPGQERQLCSQFFARAAAEYEFGYGCLIRINDQDETIARRFLRLWGTDLKETNFGSLTSQQCEQALDELIKDQALMSDKRRPVTLMESFTISKWRIGEEAFATSSVMNWYYGSSARVATFLQFDSVEHFRYIRDILHELGICTLDQRHLKHATNA